MRTNNIRHLLKLCVIKTRNYCTTTENRSTLTISSIIDKWEQKFKSNNISEPDLSIRHIMAHVLNIPNINELNLVSTNVLTPAQTLQLEKFCQCRLSHMPIQYIVGNWQFIDLNIRLVPPVFIPRPETEEFVDIISTKLKSSNSKAKILEIGCGSGVISLSLLKAFSQIECTAIDQSKFACDLTLQNCQVNNLDLNRLYVHHAKVTENGIFNVNLEKKFDFIVSNPPYISEKTLPSLSPDITLYEDIQALNGGEDGLRVIKQIICLAPKFLLSHGKLFLEIDPQHPEMIGDYITKIQSKLHIAQVYRDFTKQNRFIELSNS